MRFKILILFLLGLFLSSCENYNSSKSQKINKDIEKKYTNMGFALIYDENLNIKKLDDRSLFIFQKSLKKNHLLKLQIP